MSNIVNDLPAKYILSIDIETLDVKPTAKVLSIGATIIDIRTLKVVSYFDVNIDPFCIFQNRSGRTINMYTVKWWRTRKPDNPKFPTEAAYTLTHNGTLNTVEALDMFIEWLNKNYTPINQDCLVNARGPEFDLVILDHLANSVGKFLPLLFLNYDSNRTTERYAKMAGIPATTQEELRHILPFDCHIAHTARYDSAWEGIDAAKSYQAIWWLFNYGRDVMNEVISEWSNGTYRVINNDK